MTAIDCIDPVRFPAHPVSSRITGDRLGPSIEPRGLLPDTGRLCAVPLFGRRRGGLWVSDT